MKPVEAHEFLCRCSDEGVKRCDEVRAAALEDFHEGTAEDWEKLLWYLGSYSYKGVGLATDMWGGISVSYKDAECRIQFDDLLDGLCGAYLWLRDREAHEGVIP